MVCTSYRGLGYGRTGKVRRIHNIVMHLPIAKDYSRSWERKRLNERALYLRSHCLMLAIVQTIIHLSYDNDSIRISTSVPSFSKHSYQRFQIELPPIQRVRLELPSMLRQIATLSLFMAFSGPIFYAMFLRRRAWTVSMALASTFMDVPRSGKLSYIPPYHITLVLRSLISGSLLLLLWRGSNVLFSVYVGQEPLKGGEPITNETKDPNGSLISGLKAKKQLPKVFRSIFVYSFFL